MVMSKGVTWTVLGEDYHVAEPAEQYLEHLRSRDCSPNTLKSYARGLALWWTFLERRAQSWDAIGVTELAMFVGKLRRGSVAEDVAPLHDGTKAADATVASRARAVMGFYRYHAARGVEVAGRLYETVKARPGRYLPFLEHVARRTGRRSGVVRMCTDGAGAAARPDVSAPRGGGDLGRGGRGLVGRAAVSPAVDPAGGDRAAARRGSGPVAP
ncbi:hypothetical protein GCM10010145_38970 [Streptomyces ruber]|uniref:Core-binding (CB) domain-containing protein n=2 Tax=Streptomyces TaxID=1883 RepID=A0A918BGI4_9ACTN|nr:hypothetical protein GCM10010145_38970 [Streptomyces ruber]